MINSIIADRSQLPGMRFAELTTVALWQWNDCRRAPATTAYSYTISANLRKIIIFVLIRGALISRLDILAFLRSFMKTQCNKLISARHRSWMGSKLREYLRVTCSTSFQRKTYPFPEDVVNPWQHQLQIHHSLFGIDFNLQSSAKMAYRTS